MLFSVNAQFKPPELFYHSFVTENISAGRPAIWLDSFHKLCYALIRTRVSVIKKFA